MIFLIERLKSCQEIDDIIVATTVNKEDDSLSSLIMKEGLSVIRGSEDDVLSRFVLAANQTNAEIFVRITGDCPLMDPYLVDNAVDIFKKNKFDFLSNTDPPSYPDGLDIEIFNRRSLLLAQSESVDFTQREHVTPWIRDSGCCRVAEKKYHVDYSSMRWTVDEPEDLQVIRSVVAVLTECGALRTS